MDATLCIGSPEIVNEADHERNVMDFRRHPRSRRVACGCGRVILAVPIDQASGRDPPLDRGLHLGQALRPRTLVVRPGITRDECQPGGAGVVGGTAVLSWEPSHVASEILGLASHVARHSPSSHDGPRIRRVQGLVPRPASGRGLDRMCQVRARKRSRDPGSRASPKGSRRRDRQPPERTESPGSQAEPSVAVSVRQCKSRAGGFRGVQPRQSRLVYPGNVTSSTSRLVLKPLIAALKIWYGHGSENFQRIDRGPKPSNPVLECETIVTAIHGEVSSP